VPSRSLVLLRSQDGAGACALTGDCAGAAQPKQNRGPSAKASTYSAWSTSCRSVTATTLTTPNSRETIRRQRCINSSLLALSFSIPDDPTDRLTRQITLPPDRPAALKPARPELQFTPAPPRVSTQGLLAYKRAWRKTRSSLAFRVTLLDDRPAPDTGRPERSPGRRS